MAMVKTQMRANIDGGKSRGKSLRASRFVDSGNDSMLATMPQSSGGINGNGRM